MGVSDTEGPLGRYNPEDMTTGVYYVSEYGGSKEVAVLTDDGDLEITPINHEMYL